MSGRVKTSPEMSAVRIPSTPTQLNSGKLSSAQSRSTTQVNSSQEKSVRIGPHKGKEESKFERVSSDQAEEEAREGEEETTRTLSDQGRGKGEDETNSEGSGKGLKEAEQV